MTDLTTVEFPEDRVYNDCKTILTLDHNGHITATYIDTKTGDDVIMVYLGKKEIQWIAKTYLENKDFVDNEGQKKEEKEDATPSNTMATPTPIPIPIPKTP
jgi:hypothetical protein